jgi:hypothetical protein
LILRATILIIAAAGASLACEKPEPPVVHVRLLTPLATDSSKLGSAFTTVVTTPMLYCGEVLIPSGSLISGTVRRANRVGLGVLRERAAMELNFTTFESPDGQTYQLGAQLTAVDNAREEVTSHGQIKGILAASSTNRLIRGVWFRPSEDLLPHTMMGLTGASEKLWSGFGMGPQGAAALFAARLILFRFPDPEISLPFGTDMQIRVTSLPEDIPSFPAPPVSEVSESLAEWLRNQPVEVTKSDDAPAEDIVNFAFVGTEDQLLRAFERAGWDPADALTSRSFSRSFTAYTTLKAYPTAPVSRLYYRGASPNFVFQKSLNTMSKRHHIRVWSAGLVDNQELWLGAATHDIGVSLRTKSLTLTHNVDPQIDLERDKVAEDLSFTECVEAPGYVDRSDVTRTGAEHKSRNTSPISTDGRMTVFVLRDCDKASDDPSPLKHRGHKVDKLARRLMLETRQYLMRDNLYYYGFEEAKKIVRRSPPSAQKTMALAAAGKVPKHPARQISTSFSWTSPVTNAVSSPTNTFSSDLTPNSGR